MNIFNEGKEQNVAQALNAKDKCVLCSKRFLPSIQIRRLVDVNLNITGPIKKSLLREAV